MKPPKKQTILVAILRRDKSIQMANSASMKPPKKQIKSAESPLQIAPYNWPKLNPCGNQTTKEANKICRISSPDRSL
jgi:hypothetical protein